VLTKIRNAQFVRMGELRKKKSKAWQAVNVGLDRVSRGFGRGVVLKLERPEDDPFEKLGGCTKARTKKLVGRSGG